MTSLRAACKMQRSRISKANARMCWLFSVCAFILINATIALKSKDIQFDATKETMSLVLPHDTYPGFNIQRISSQANSSKTVSHTDFPSSYTLVHKKYSKYFTVLEDGMLMTTSDLSPLVDHPVDLVVLEETPNTTVAHQLQLFVMNSKDMLHFPTANVDVTGEVYENKAAGSRVQGVPLLQANSISGKKAITYAIASGNSDGAFTLQHSRTNSMQSKVTIKPKEKAGVWLVTNKKLDRETKEKYEIAVQATDNEGIDKAVTKIIVTILDDNDNRPVFIQPNFKFAIVGNKTNVLDSNSSITWQRFTSIGRVEAKDADGDKIAYRLLTPNNIIVIVQQTGELLLAGEPYSSEMMLKVEAHDLRTPSLPSKKPVDVLVEFVAPNPVSQIMQQLEHDEAFNQHTHRRDKRRVTRAVRPTKRIEFTEASSK